MIAHFAQSRHPDVSSFTQSKSRPTKRRQRDTTNSGSNSKRGEKRAISRSKSRSRSRSPESKCYNIALFNAECYLCFKVIHDIIQYQCLECQSIIICSGCTLMPLCFTLVITLSKFLCDLNGTILIYAQPGVTRVSCIKTYKTRRRRANSPPRTQPSKTSYYSLSNLYIVITTIDKV